MDKYKIGVFVGSLRKESFNLKFARSMAKMAPSSLSLEIIGIGDLPMFNQDLEDQPPQEWLRFREQIRSCQGLLFLTPEYNRSVPAVLKNAIDVGSRPYGQNSWEGKPAAVVSVSIGAISGFGANHHLRQSLVFVNAPTMAQPEAYIGNCTQMFDDQGELNDNSTKQFLNTFLESFEKWVKLHSKG